MATALEELHERDFYAWTKDQAAALRKLAAERWNGPLDLERLAEEVEDIGCERRFRVEAELDRLMELMLKLEFSGDGARRRTWMVEALEARFEIEPRLTPAMRAEIEPSLDRMFGHARRVAALRLADAGEEEAARELPRVRLYTLDQLLDEDWLPESRHGFLDGLP